MFIKLLKFDIKNGIIKRLWVFGLAFLLFILADIILYFQRLNIGIEHPELLEQNFTLGDILLYTVGGSKKFVIENDTSFIFPVLWAFVILVIAFAVLRYPTDELCKFGRHILILSGNRKAWWISKCCWLLLSVGAYYFVMLISAIVFGYLTGATFNLNISEFLLQVMQFDLSALTQPPWNLWEPLLLHVWVVYTLCLMQMLLSLYLRPLISFFCTSAVLVFSVLFSSPMLIGNYAIPLRTENIITDNPMRIGLGFVVCTVLCVIMLVLGLFKINRMDILTKEE